MRTGHVTEIITEKKIKNNLVILSALVSVVTLLLMAAAVLMSIALHNIENDSVDFRISAETNAISSNIQRHIAADFRVLETASSFVESTVSRESDNVDLDVIEKALQESDFPRDFLSVLFFRKDGNGIEKNIKNKSAFHKKLADTNPAIQEAVAAAFAGNNASTRFFFSEEFGCKISVHAAPVYHENKIVGVITGSHGIEEVSKIINLVPIPDADYNFFILDEEANLLVESEHNKFPVADRENNTGGYFLPPHFYSKVWKNIAQKNEVMFSFEHGGIKCRAYVKQLDFCGLYLLCVKTSFYSTTVTDYYVYFTRIIFTSMCVIMILVILIGYRLLNKYSKHLISIMYSDPLTGADNLNRFKVTLSYKCEKGNREDLSVVTLNVRRFKFINEIFETTGANRILFIIKETLEENLSAIEFFCRENVDVFHLCMYENDREKIKQRIEIIISEIQKKLSIFDDYHLQIYAGAATFKNNKGSVITVDEILIHVSLALSQARLDTVNTISFYDEDLHEKEKTKNYIESHMDTALAKGNFKVYLQPKIDLRTGELGGAEALVRWETKDDRIILPEQFIPLFEQNGFCTKLDMFMFEEVCKLLRGWIDEKLEPLPVSVNQSKLMFFEPNYVNDIKALVAKYGIPPGIITLEVLEQLALEDLEAMDAKISILRQEGFLISMDDFGSGYSAFSALGDLSIDELKLDRVFLQKANRKENWRTKIVIDQIVRMARRLYLSVVAEGVETEEDEILVKTLGCDFAQGYYYCRPIPADEFTEYYMKTSPPPHTHTRKFD